MAGTSAGAKKGWAHRSRFPVTRGLIASTRARLGLKGLAQSSRVKTIRGLKGSMLNKSRMRERIAEIKASLSSPWGKQHAAAIVAWNTRDFHPKESRVIRRIFRGRGAR